VKDSDSSSPSDRFALAVWAVGANNDQLVATKACECLDVARAMLPRHLDLGLRNELSRCTIESEGEQAIMDLVVCHDQEVRVPGRPDDGRCLADGGPFAAHELR